MSEWKPACSIYTRYLKSTLSNISRSSKTACSESNTSSPRHHRHRLSSASACFHYRPLDKKSLQVLNKKVSARLAPNTQDNYDQYISVFKVKTA